MPFMSQTKQLCAIHSIYRDRGKRCAGRRGPRTSNRRPRACEGVRFELAGLGRFVRSRRKVTADVVDAPVGTGSFSASGEADGLGVALCIGPPGPRQSRPGGLCPPGLGLRLRGTRPGSAACSRPPAERSTVPRSTTSPADRRMDQGVLRPPVREAVADRITHKAHITDTGAESWRFRHGLDRQRGKRA
jgi:hypothetical protein